MLLGLLTVCTFTQQNVSFCKPEKRYSNILAYSIVIYCTVLYQPACGIKLPNMNKKIKLSKIKNSFYTVHRRCNQMCNIQGGNLLAFAKEYMYIRMKLEIYSSVYCETSLLCQQIEGAIFLAPLHQHLQVMNSVYLLKGLMRCLVTIMPRKRSLIQKTEVACIQIYLEGISISSFSISPR